MNSPPAAKTTPTQPLPPPPESFYFCIVSTFHSHTIIPPFLSKHSSSPPPKHNFAQPPQSVTFSGNKAICELYTAEHNGAVMDTDIVLVRNNPTSHTIPESFLPSSSTDVGPPILLRFFCCCYSYPPLYAARSLLPSHEPSSNPTAAHNIKMLMPFVFLRI